MCKLFIEILGGFVCCWIIYWFILAPTGFFRTKIGRRGKIVREEIDPPDTNY